MTGPSGIASQPIYPALIIRAADEGVPIGSINRIFNHLPDNSSIDVRKVLHAAVQSGRLIEMPKEDWPPLQSSTARTPTVAPHKVVEDEKDTLMRTARKMKLTKLECRILLVLLRRGQASREQLHMAVEDNRGNPDDATDIKIVDVVICKMRKKLERFGLKLNTIHSFGYEMTEEYRSKAWSIVNG